MRGVSTTHLRGYPLLTDARIAHLFVRARSLRVSCLKRFLFQTHYIAFGIAESNEKRNTFDYLFAESTITRDSNARKE